MTCMNTDEGVYIKDTSDPSTLFAFLGGLCAMIFFPVGIGALLQGEWQGLIALGIPAGVVALGRWFARVTPEYQAILYHDRIEFPDGDPVLWEEVEKIRWQVEEKGKSSIRFHVPACEKRPTGQVGIQLASMSRGDRLRLIQYVRKFGETLEQERWPSFCRKRAVPLAECCQTKKIGGEQGTGAEASSLTPAFVWRFFETHPFVAGATVLPATVAFMFLRLLSRRAWWLLAGLISVSAFINIRLIWGAWVAPFTKICLGMAIVFFVIGLVAPASVPTSRKTRVSDLAFYSVLAFFIIGMPLFGNAAVLGWLPRPVVQVGKYVFLVLFCGLPVFLSFTTARREAKERPALESDALRRWEIYEETGRIARVGPG
jgi:hypothetical protein